MTGRIYCEYIWIIAHAPTIYSDYCSRSNNQMPPPDANMSVQWRHLDQTKYKIKMETYGKLSLNKTSCYGCHPQERLRGEILSRFRGVWFPRQNWITAPVPRSNYRLYCKLKSSSEHNNAIGLCGVQFSEVGVTLNLECYGDELNRRFVFSALLASISSDSVKNMWGAGDFISVTLACEGLGQLGHTRGCWRPPAPCVISISGKVSLQRASFFGTNPLMRGTGMMRIWRPI